MCLTLSVCNVIGKTTVYILEHNPVPSLHHACLRLTDIPNSPDVRRIANNIIYQ